MEFTPIAEIRTCFKEKFGIPRQPNLVPQARGEIVFFPEFAREEAVRELSCFSHIWLIFCFHQSIDKDGGRTWSPMVRPPRLGGNKKVGVFASRSPFRPNPIGMSCVRLESVTYGEQGPVLHLSGVDLLDKTPILDIKPYLPYSDILPNATDGFAPGPPRAGLAVIFSDQARADLKRYPQIPHLEALVRGILEHDPRPAYSEEDTDRIYGIHLFDFDLKFSFARGQVTVLALEGKGDSPER